MLKSIFDINNVDILINNDNCANKYWGIFRRLRYEKNEIESWLRKHTKQVAEISKQLKFLQHVKKIHKNPCNLWNYSRIMTETKQIKEENGASAKNGHDSELEKRIVQQVRT